jgi:hypothetical protein
MQANVYNELLHHGGKATNNQLAKVAGHRFGARVWELEQMGFSITCKKVPADRANGCDGLTIYTLHGVPADWTPIYSFSAGVTHHTDETGVSVSASGTPSRPPDPERTPPRTADPDRASTPTKFRGVSKKPHDLKYIGRVLWNGTQDTWECASCGKRYDNPKELYGIFGLGCGA